MEKRSFMPGHATFSDVLVGIFYFFPNGIYAFRWDCEEVQRFFYEQRRKYPDLFVGNLVFREGGLFPESGDIEQARAILIQSGLLESYGMGFNPHQFAEEECRRTFERSSRQRFSKKQLKALEEISRDFQDRFSADAVT